MGIRKWMLGDQEGPLRTQEPLSIGGSLFVPRLSYGGMLPSARRVPSTDSVLASTLTTPPGSDSELIGPCKRSMRRELGELENSQHRGMAGGRILPSSC